MSKGRSHSVYFKEVMAQGFIVVSSAYAKTGIHKVVSRVTTLWFQVPCGVSSVTVTYDSLVSNFSSERNDVQVVTQDTTVSIPPYGLSLYIFVCDCVEIRQDLIIILIP